MTTDDRTATTASDPAADTAAEGAIDTVIELSERERAIIEFEGTWWMQDDARDAMIRSRFQCSSEEYYQELNQLLDHPGALTFDPLVVRRLRRQRERRRRARLDGPSNVGTASGHQAGQQGGKG